MTESYHFQIEPEPAKEALFRVGGVYRDGSGTTHLLRSAGGEQFAIAARWDEVGRRFDTRGEFHRLDNGRFDALAEEDECHWHLVPGELIYRSGEWVPMDAPATIGPFGSGASLKTDGSHITGRIEPEPDGLPWDNAKPGAIVHVPKPTQYTLRAAEPKAETTGRWVGFVSVRGAVKHAEYAQEPQPFHPLQRMTADSPTHGSAHLLAKP